MLPRTWSSFSFWGWEKSLPGMQKALTEGSTTRTGTTCERSEWTEYLRHEYFTGKYLASSALPIEAGCLSHLPRPAACRAQQCCYNQPCSLHTAGCTAWPWGVQEHKCLGTPMVPWLQDTSRCYKTHKTITWHICYRVDSDLKPLYAPCIYIYISFDTLIYFRQR